MVIRREGRDSMTDLAAEASWTYLQRDLVTGPAAERAERLLEEGKPHEALEVLLEERRRQRRIEQPVDRPERTSA